MTPALVSVWSASRGPRAWHPGRCGHAWMLLLAVVVAILIGGTLSSAAVSPPVGAPAPPITLPDLAGKQVDLSKSAPKSQVLIFGDLAHEGVRKTIKDAVSVVTDPRFAADPVVTVLIIAHNDSPDRLNEEIAAGGFPSLVLLDSNRSAFGAYRILVMPTVVVVDPQGKVVHSMSGPVQHFKESLSAALLLCAGRMSEEQFRRSIMPEAAPATTPAATRAERLIHLGNELARHGLYELAESRYKEASDIAPDNLDARIGLASVMVRTNRLDEAETTYRAALSTNKGSIDAAIGIATVQALRGGDGLDKAESAATEIVAKYPSMPKARFLMGLIYERKGNCTAAIGEYRRAAELLISN